LQLSHNSDFFFSQFGRLYHTIMTSHNYKFISCNSYFISQNCEVMAHDFKKKVRSVRYKFYFIFNWDTILTFFSFKSSCFYLIILFSPKSESMFHNSVFFSAKKRSQLPFTLLLPLLYFITWQKDTSIKETPTRFKSVQFRSQKILKK